MMLTSQEYLSAAPCEQNKGGSFAGHFPPGQGRHAAAPRARTCSQVIEGTSTLLFFWPGQERAPVLAQLCDETAEFDPLLDIDGSFIGTTGGQRGTFLMLHRRGPDAEENRRHLRRVAMRMEAFAGRPFLADECDAPEFRAAG